MKTKLIHYQLCGLEYVFLNAPTAKTSIGEEFIDLPMQNIDQMIAKKIIEERVPIRGAEAKFLRKALGLSLSSWARLFGFSAAGVLKWEKDRNKRLSLVNEVAVRSYCAEMLKVKLAGKWSELVGDDKTPEKIELKVA